MLADGRYFRFIYSCDCLNSGVVLPKCMKILTNYHWLIANG